MTLTTQNQDRPHVEPSPSHGGGLFGWLRRWRRERRRQRIEDLIKHVNSCMRRGRTASLESVAGFLRVSTDRAARLIAEAETGGLLHRTGTRLELTEVGRELAISVVRAHRLWERYLADEAGMSLSRVHAAANRLEHARDGHRVDELAAILGHPQTDPHGDPIPSSTGDFAAAPGVPLTDWPVNEPCRVVHLEDEPASVFQQLVALGLSPGQRLIPLGRGDDQQLRVDIDGADRLLSPTLASNIFVEPAVEAVLPRRLRRLTTLRQGEHGVICAIDDTMRGFHRRRLLDLGLTPGTQVTAEHTAMFRDPTAYRVRGTLIALRREQADRIYLEPISAESN